MSQLRFGDSSLGGNVIAADSVGGILADLYQWCRPGCVRANSRTIRNRGDAGRSQRLHSARRRPAGFPPARSSRSVELWFKTTATTQQSLFAYGSFANAEEFGLWINAGGTGFTRWGWGGAYDEVFAAAANVEDGKWHQVVETYNGAALTVYLDGASLGSATTTRNTVIDSYGLQIGDVVDPGDPNSGFDFKGSLDEFSVYSAALTPTDVTNHYQLGANTGADSTGPTGGSVLASGLHGNRLALLHLDDAEPHTREGNGRDGCRADGSAAVPRVRATDVHGECRRRLRRLQRLRPGRDRPRDAIRRHCRRPDVLRLPVLGPDVLGNYSDLRQLADQG